MSASVLLVALGSCSYSFDIKAVAIGGDLAFVVAPGSRVSSDCVTTIIVETDGSPANPEAGDDAQLVASGAYRWQSVAHEDGCKNPFPIFYARPLKGAPRIYDLPGPDEGKTASAVSPKPLRIGVIYTVMITAGATGYGGGRFRLDRNKIIENLGRETNANAAN